MFGRVQQSIVTSTSPGAVQSRKHHLMLVTVAVIAALVLSQLGSLLHPLIARAYSCGDANMHHCYATNDTWMNTTNGGETYILMVQLSCDVSRCQGGYGDEIAFVDNEIWLNAKFDSRCSNQSNICWVETGYVTVTHLSTKVDYFWADNRPNKGFFFHDIRQVPSGDYDYYTQFLIQKDFANQNTFDVYFQSHTLTYSATSTSNPMFPNDITIGQELAGSSGASAPAAYFVNNQYQDGTGSWHYLPNTGAVTSGSPPYDSWSSNSNGGTLETWCC